MHTNFKIQRYFFRILFFLTFYDIGDNPILYMKKTKKINICRTQEEKSRLCTRLHRIQGQLKAIETAIENDRECMEVLRQMNSAASALKGVWLQFLEGHLKGCISNSLKHRDDSLVDELVEHLRKAK